MLCILFFLQRVRQRRIIRSLLLTIRDEILARYRVKAVHKKYLFIILLILQVQRTRRYAIVLIFERHDKNWGSNMRNFWKVAQSFWPFLLARSFCSQERV
jgi:hypothetical protein